MADVKPTEADLTRDLEADLAFVAEKNAITLTGRPNAYDIEDDVDIAMRARADDAWPAAIRRAISAEAAAARLRSLIHTLLTSLKGVRVNGDYGGVPLWSVVGNLMGLGSTSATQLCQEFGVDPHQKTNDWSDIPKEDEDS